MLESEGKDAESEPASSEWRAGSPQRAPERHGTGSPPSLRGVGSGLVVKADRAGRWWTRGVDRGRDGPTARRPPGSRLVGDVRCKPHAVWLGNAGLLVVCRSFGLPGASLAQRPAVPPARAGGLLWKRGLAPSEARCLYPFPTRRRTECVLVRPRAGGSPGGPGRSRGIQTRSRCRGRPWGAPAARRRAPWQTRRTAAGGRGRGPA